MNKNENYRRVVPRVQFESECELYAVCTNLLCVYIELVQRVITDKLGERVASPLAWTELEQLMFGISTFDEILDEALPLVLLTTKGNGVLYAHELNACIVRCINRHNIIFFHGKTSFCEDELRNSLAELLVRVLVSSSNSHYHALFEENFERFVAWNMHEWLVCPRHLVAEYVFAVVALGDEYYLHDDLVLEILRLLGFVPLLSSNRRDESTTRQAG